MRQEQQIKLANSSKWHGADRWAWDVWVEAPPERLEEIERVEYVLHPTFPERVQRVSNREGKFKLSGRGWGEFMIHANATLKNGETLQLNHWLHFHDPEAGKQSAEEKPTVFLSYSRADYPLALELRRLFEKRGLEVISGQDFEATDSLGSATSSLLGKADAVVALLPEEPSEWVLNELEQARKQQLVILPILLGPEVAPPRIIADLEFIRIEKPDDRQALIQAVQQELEKLNL